MEDNDSLDTESDLDGFGKFVRRVLLTTLEKTIPSLKRQRKGHLEYLRIESKEEPSKE